MQTFCTIITADYLPFAKVLHTSLQKNVPGTSLQVLVVDKNDFTSSQDFIIHSVDSVVTSAVAKAIYKKYAATNTDQFRWALKPVLITYLLEKGFDKVIFTDPDIFFVRSFDFIFRQLDSASVLLTPHWNNINVLQFEDGLFSIMRNGLFNAGFIGANKKGLPALQWWAGVCHYKMDRQPELGVYDDQKYLDILPLEFPGTEILRHPGCNLASWNIDTCKREMTNGKLFINKTFEPVFIHFTKDTIINILNKNDKLLSPYLDEYIKALRDENFDLLKILNEFDPAKYNSALYSIKHKLRLRTRFKRFLFKLAEKL